MAAVEIASDPQPTNEGKRTAMVICWLLGSGCLFSWNSMVTIEDYYSKLYPKCLYLRFLHRDFTPTRVLTLIYQPLAIGTLAILAHNASKINTRSRVLSGFSIFFVASLSLVMTDVVTGGRGVIGSFLVICLNSAMFGIGSACTEGGVVGDVSIMCPEFVQSFSAGMGTAGVLTTALRMLTKAAFERAENGLRKGAIMFFTVSALFQLSCIVAYARVFPTLPIVKYYRLKAANEGCKSVLADLTTSGIKVEQREEDVEDQRKETFLTNKQLILENMDYAMDLFLTYVLTLSIFPGFLVEDVRSSRLGSWYPLILIAAFNAFDLAGRYIPTRSCSTGVMHRRYLMIFVLLRFFLIPAFYFNRKHGTVGWMLTLTSFLGLTNGCLTVCVLTAAPQGYKGPEQNSLGNLLVLFLISGIATGVALGWLWLIGNGW